MELNSSVLGKCTRVLVRNQKQQKGDIDVDIDKRRSIIGLVHVIMPSASWNTRQIGGLNSV